MPPPDDRVDALRFAMLSLMPERPPVTHPNHRCVISPIEDAFYTDRLLQESRAEEQAHLFARASGGDILFLGGSPGTWAVTVPFRAGGVVFTWGAETHPGQWDFMWARAREMGLLGAVEA